MASIFRSGLLRGSLVLAMVALALAPAVQAHECDSCSPTGCVNGEDHYHKNFQGYCRSSADSPPQKKCYIADLEFDKVFCMWVDSVADLLPVQAVRE